MKWSHLAAGAALLVLLVATLRQRSDDSALPASPAVSPAPAAAPPAAQAQGARASAWPALPPELASTSPERAVPAWASLAEGRERGDSRAPPLQRQADSANAPSAAQLADPAAYRTYEQGQNARTLAAFAAAAPTQAALLRADVEQARARGIAPEEIRKVEQKIQRLEELRRHIAEQGKVP